MIVCSCNIITERDIEQVIIGLLDEQEWRLIVPAQVYHTLGKFGKCCGCFPNVSQIIVRVTEQYHLEKETPHGLLQTLLSNLGEKHLNYQSALSKIKRKQLKPQFGLSGRLYFSKI